MYTLNFFLLFSIPVKVILMYFFLKFPDIISIFVVVCFMDVNFSQISMKIAIDCMCTSPHDSYVETKSPVWRYLQVELWKIIRSWGWIPYEWNSCSCKRDSRELPWHFLPCDNSPRSQPSMNQGESPPQTLNLLASWSWTSQELLEIIPGVPKPPNLWYFC